MPTEWLFSLVPAVSAACWVVARRDLAVRALVVAVWAFYFWAAMLQRSRAVLVFGVATVLVILLMSEVRRTRRLWLYGLFIALLPVLAVFSNIILQNRQTGVLHAYLWGKAEYESLPINADVRTVTEDNVYFLAKAVDVVPEKEGFRSPLELYFFLAINPIPRFLWPSKPYMSQDYLGKMRPYYAAITGMGDMYVYGGWLHVLIGAAIVGFLLKKIDSLDWAQGRNRMGMITIYVIILFPLGGVIRALWSALVGYYSTAFFLAIVFVLSSMGRFRMASRGETASRGPQSPHGASAATGR